MLERYVIHVTKKCNMNCFYCYEKDKTSKYSKDEVVKFAKKLASSCTDNKFGIEFLGGEPMLAFDIIKAVYEKMEKDFAERVKDYVITTNGTILNEEIKSYLSKHNKIIYAVSMDGTKWANQFRTFKNGLNSFDVASRNIEWAVKNLCPEQVNVHIVTHPFNVGNIYNSIHYLYNIGVRSIGVGTVENTMKIDAAYCDRFVRELNKVSFDMKAGLLNGLHIDLFSYIKPKSDVRTYIYDSQSGKTIGESYGRAKNDLTHEIDDMYKSIQTDSKISDLIYNLRKCVYDNHRFIMRK